MIPIILLVLVSFWGIVTLGLFVGLLLLHLKMDKMGRQLGEVLALVGGAPPPPEPKTVRDRLLDFPSRIAMDHQQGYSSLDIPGVTHAKMSGKESQKIPPGAPGIDFGSEEGEQ